MVATDVDVAVDDRPRYVSRGGTKLANALDALGLDVADRRALDAGASTGGFTDVLLQRGADHVVAVDVAYGELDWGLRNDERVTVLERTNVRALSPSDLPYAPDLLVADLSFISLRKVLPALLGCMAPRFDALVMVKPQFEVGQGRVGGGGVVRDAGRPALVARRRRRPPRRSSARRSWASRPRGCPGRRATGRRSPGSPRAAGRARSRTSRPPPRRSSRVSACARVTVLTHQRPGADRRGDRQLVADARREGVELRFDAEEAAKHAVTAEEGVVARRERPPDVDLCIALGGDGTILRALRRYARTGVPVFAVNFGEVGFLATVDPDEMSRGLRAGVRGRVRACSTCRRSASTLDERRTSRSTTSRCTGASGERVAELAYVLDGEEVGSVRCDGIVVCTPAGSTGYNLANGGPVMAWGVEGFGVSFIAPHSLAARVAGRRARRRRCDPEPVGARRGPLGRRPAGGRAGAGDRAARRASCATRRVLAQQPGDVLLPPVAGEVRPAVARRL